MSADYARHLLVWSLPVALSHWALAPRKLWHARRALVVGTLGPGLWLSACDALAIHTGVWSFGEAHLIGPRVLGVPVEEIGFFLITSLLVAQSLAVFSREKGGAR